MISDFGESTIINHISERTGTTGTLEFMVAFLINICHIASHIYQAPELLKQDVRGHFVAQHSVKGDIWSLGMILYFLCYSKVPFSQIDDVDILRSEILAYVRGEKPFEFPSDGRISPELTVLMKRLLNVDPDMRPSLEEILAERGDPRSRTMSVATSYLTEVQSSEDEMIMALTPSKKGLKKRPSDRESRKPPNLMVFFLSILIKVSSSAVLKEYL